MSRWMAWQGQPVLLDELLFDAQHGLIDERLHARLGAETTNVAGFGVGWYGSGDGPGVYRSVSPAWNDASLRRLAGHVESPLFLAHVRATSDTVVQQSNCHPFRHGQWLFVHDGLIADFHVVRRELMRAVDPDLLAGIEGSTDSEVLFHLALTYDLDHDPLAALERAIGFVETVAQKHGIARAVQASIGLSDGERVWAVRYSTEGNSRSLYTSADLHALRLLYPDNPRVQRLGDDDHIIVSRPLADLAGAWDELPEASAIIVRPDGPAEPTPFRPRLD